MMIADSIFDVNQDKSTSQIRGADGHEWFVVGYFDGRFSKQVERELDEIGNLPNNWDREGAPVISADVIEAVRKFIDDLPPTLVKSPDIAPLANGTLQLEWSAGSRYLEFEFESPEVIHFLKLDPTSDTEEEGEFKVKDTARAVELIRWFIGGTLNVRRFLTRA